MNLSQRDQVGKFLSGDDVLLHFPVSMGSVQFASSSNVHSQKATSAESTINRGTQLLLGGHRSVLKRLKDSLGSDLELF